MSQTVNDLGTSFLENSHLSSELNIKIHIMTTTGLAIRALFRQFAM